MVLVNRSEKKLNRKLEQLISQLKRQKFDLQNRFREIIMDYIDIYAEHYKLSSDQKQVLLSKYLNILKSEDTAIDLKKIKSDLKIAELNSL